MKSKNNIKAKGKSNFVQNNLTIFAEINEVFKLFNFNMLDFIFVVSCSLSSFLALLVVSGVIKL